MKPPKCKNCGKEEWRHVCGGIPDIPAVSSPKDQAKPTMPAKRAKSRGTFDRTAYQRELMRKRRAAEKAAKTP